MIFFFSIGIHVDLLCQLLVLFSFVFITVNWKAKVTRTRLTVDKAGILFLFPSKLHFNCFKILSLSFYYYSLYIVFIKYFSLHTYSTQNGQVILLYSAPDGNTGGKTKKTKDHRLIHSDWSISSLSGWNNERSFQDGELVKRENDVFSPFLTTCCIQLLVRETHQKRIKHQALRK